MYLSIDNCKKGTSSERKEGDRILEMERDLLLVATVEVGLLTLVINLRIASPRIAFLPVNSSSYNKTLSRDFVVSWLMTVLFYAIMVCCYCY